MARVVTGVGSLLSSGDHQHQCEWGGVVVGVWGVGGCGVTGWLYPGAIGIDDVGGWVAWRWGRVVVMAGDDWLSSWPSPLKCAGGWVDDIGRFMFLDALPPAYRTCTRLQSRSGQRGAPSRASRGRCRVRRPCPGRLRDLGMCMAGAAGWAGLVENPTGTTDNTVQRIVAGKARLGVSASSSGTG